MTDIPQALIVEVDPSDPQGTRDRVAATFLAYGSVAIRMPGEPPRPIAFRRKPAEFYGTPPGLVTQGPIHTDEPDCHLFGFPVHRIPE